MIYDNLKPETSDYLTKIEIKSRKKLKNLRETPQIRGMTLLYSTKKRNAIKNNDVSILHNENRKHKNVANPLMRMLILGMVWKSWVAYTNKKMEVTYISCSDHNNSEEELKNN